MGNVNDEAGGAEINADDPRGLLEGCRKCIGSRGMVLWAHRRGSYYILTTPSRAAYVLVGDRAAQIESDLSALGIDITAPTFQARYLDASDTTCLDGYAWQDAIGRHLLSAIKPTESDAT